MTQNFLLKRIRSEEKFLPDSSYCIAWCRVLIKVAQLLAVSSEMQQAAVVVSATISRLFCIYTKDLICVNINVYQCVLLF